jgi:hypothetical protein
LRQHGERWDVVDHIEKEIEKETEAIRTVIQALEPLSPEVRGHVIGYALSRLGIVPSPSPQTSTHVSSFGGNATLVKPEGSGEPAPAHIKDFKDQKRPRSASEMAALVAYYLANVAPQKDRKDRITTKDVETYFKIAEYPLPEKIQFTLPNAKAAGYVDAVGNGGYKLNAVGHNLVVHSMPRGADRKKASKRRPAKKSKRPKSGN